MPLLPRLEKCGWEASYTNQDPQQSKRERHVLLRLKTPQTMLAERYIQLINTNKLIATANYRTHSGRREGNSALTISNYLKAQQTNTASGKGDHMSLHEQKGDEATSLQGKVTEPEIVSLEKR